MRTLKLTTVVGARPQFIKAAALSRSIDRHNTSGSAVAIEQTLVHSGQHYDYGMSGVFFNELQLPEPAHHLAVGSGSHGIQTGEILIRLEPVLATEPPDLVLTYGDTNTTLAAALAAAKLNLQIGHVEAGLRSGRREMPEEINRVVTDHLSSLLLCPSEHARRNLQGEGIHSGVYVVGDVMRDVFLDHLGPASVRGELLARFGLEPAKYAFATVHRAANTDDPDRLERIVSGLSLLAKRGLPVVFVVHPRTEKVMQHLGISCEGAHVLQPASYEQTLNLQMNARVIITDSGGVQKEAHWLGVPCVTLREETEWVETVESGWNSLVDAESNEIAEAALLSSRPNDHPQLYGDGKAADKIIKLIVRHIEAIDEPARPQQKAIR